MPSLLLHYAKYMEAQVQRVDFLQFVNTDLLQNSITQVFAQVQLYQQFLFIHIPRTPFNIVPATAT